MKQEIYLINMKKDSLQFFLDEQKQEEFGGDRTVQHQKVLLVNRQSKNL